MRIKIAKLGGLNKILAILSNPEDHPVILTLALVAMNVMMMEGKAAVSKVNDYHLTYMC